MLKQKASGIKNNAASLLRAFNVFLGSIDQMSESPIMPKNNNGKSNAKLKDPLLFCAERNEYKTKRIRAILLYAYPKGNVISTADMKKTSGFLPSDSPIFFSKAFLEKL